MALFTYNLVILLLSPLILVYFLYRIFGSGKSRKAWRGQIGSVDLPEHIHNNRRIWIHAVSVGESVASSTVVSELKNQLPDAAVVLSTTTQTGQEMAHKSVKDAAGFLYYPFDLAPCVIRSLARVKPIVFASTDTEIWPNFLHFAHARGVRTALINGTVSDKTLAGARKVPWVYRWALSNIDRFCMQSQPDADRIIKLGADPERVIVTGNCKADQLDEPLGEDIKAEVRGRFKLPESAPVFIAGSTNPGEDEPVIDALLTARSEHPGLRLIIAPRQIERAQEICDLAAQKGLACARRSEPDSVSGSEDVFILDTFGELAQVYAIADVSFVGGSLIPKGCHNILQPISQGKPVFFGPHTFKAKDLVAQAKAAGVGFHIQRGEELGHEISGMLADPSVLEDIAVKCAQMLASNKGASQRTASELSALYNEGLAASGER